MHPTKNGTVKIKNSSKFQNKILEGLSKVFKMRFSDVLDTFQTPNKIVIIRPMKITISTMAPQIISGLTEEDIIL